MNINRLIGSRREKDGSSHRRQKSRDKSSEKKTRPSSSDGILSLFKSDPHKKLDKEQSLKVQAIKNRLHNRGHLGIDDDQITYALLSRYAEGNVDKALEMIILFQESVDGVIKPCNPKIQMKGAVNRELVTCYLDSTLFAMFARLGSFEPILYTLFDDEPTRRLATLIRLWVNMLRTGMLIHDDITQHLQDAIAACGWADAALLEQQDTSEAFSFLTGKLQLPLLTLKMDIYHNGAEDVKDDHKLIHERLLEVAVPDQPAKLEECLESYFNNSVEVVRKLERSNTISSMRSGRSPSIDKGSSQHVEVSVSEVSWSNPGTPTSTLPPRSPLGAGNRHRTNSLIRPRIITELKEDEKGENAVVSDVISTPKSIRKGSVRKEVLMPAWQFFNLIPWYTKNTTPTNDKDVAAHFVNTPPVLGICLKRYAMSSSGVATRKNTFIDIPVDIRLPHFVDDGPHVEGGPLMENFKLSLQSIICHRGQSVNSGHYISFVRDGVDIADGDSASSRRMSTSSQPPNYSTDRWIKHDDLAADRISPVNIEQILKEEMPYLLFYQVLPINEFNAPSSESEPPAYEHEAGIDVRVSECSPLAEKKPEGTQHGYFDNASRRDESAPAPSVRFSTEIDRSRHSVSLTEGRRGSNAPTEISLGSAAGSISVPEGRSNPVTPTEETTSQRLSRAASRFKSGSRSRPTSSSGDNRITESRISATFSRIGLRSKESVNKSENNRDSLQTSAIPSTAVSIAPSSAVSLGTTLDGASEMRDSAIAIDDNSLKPAEETPKRSKSMRGRKREKSKEPTGKAEKVEDGDHHHSHKVKGGKNVPDRECIIM